MLEYPHAKVAPSAKAKAACPWPLWGPRRGASHEGVLRLLPLGLLLLPALAQGAFAPLEDHPLRRQAEALLLAAQRGLEAQAPPFALNLQGNYTRLGYECTPPALCQGLPEEARALTLALVLTPFPFGEVADGVAQGRLGVRRAELAYRRVLASLQAQAVAAHGRYREALLGLRLAEGGVELAQRALEAARIRGANPREVREAELALQEAQNRLEEARQALALARQAAAGLVDLEAPLPEIPLPQGTVPLALEEARLGLLEAELALRSASRGLLPTLQGSYLLYPSGQDTLALTLSSRTLQPTLSYTRQDPPRPPTAVPGGSYRVREEVRLSLSLTLSPALLAALEAAEAQARGAQEALRAAEAQVRLQEASLRNALAGAERALAQAQARLEAESRRLEETRRRLELGLESPLGLLEAELGRLQAELALLRAENERRNRIMELYQFYGEILPEVNP